MSLASSLRHQFGKPEGFLGQVAGWIMANRPSNRERNRWTVDLLGLQPNARVLEIGHGPGLAIAMAAKKVTNGKVVGLDHSAAMHAQAASRNAAAIRDGRVELRLGGFEMLATLPGPFDDVFAVNVFQFLRDPDNAAEPACECQYDPSLGAMPDRRQALDGIKRVMKPNGLLAITYMPRHENAVPQDADRFADKLARDMAAAGFHSVHVEKVDLKPLPAVCVLGRA
jgi:ubiquinone/menaquinone biosynthesis C-methylase UbiE